jgi:hypothetical protein
VSLTALAGATLDIDGFNLLITLEVALGGGALFLGPDGALRDLAGLRGSYRVVPETAASLDACGAVLRASGVAYCRWFLDAPVSNAGALAATIRAWHATATIAGEVTLVPDADRALAGRREVVSSDARVIDEAVSWVALATEVVRARVSKGWLIDLRSPLPA